MNTVLQRYYSSVGKKILVTLTGLFLILFLVEHLIGNLLLFYNDNGAQYEAYSKFLTSNLIIRGIEVFLFLSIVFHALIAVTLWITNRQRRPLRYKYYRLKDTVSFSSRPGVLLTTGSFIFLFLIVHLRSFFVPLRLTKEHTSAYELVTAAFANPWYDAFYILALTLLGYHLHHGFQAAFQTLGLRTSKYARLIDAIAFLFWFLIPLAYATIPVYFYLKHIGG